MSTPEYTTNEVRGGADKGGRTEVIIDPGNGYAKRTVGFVLLAHQGITEVANPGFVSCPRDRTDRWFKTLGSALGDVARRGEWR